MCRLLIAVLLCPASALRAVPGLRATPRAPLHAPRPSTAPFSGAAVLSGALTALPTTAVLADDFWVELNKPPIELGPLKVNPIGWCLILGYVSYVAWQINKPLSEGEIKYNEKKAEEAKAAAEAARDFLKAASEEEGARVLPSGLVFREFFPGSGEAPTADSKVVVHYEGTLYDGTVFDSSIARGEPTEFKVGQVIKGWQEGLTLMTPGSKAYLTIPSELAYGEASIGQIPGNSALKFEVQLLEVKEGGGGLFGFGN